MKHLTVILMLVSAFAIAFTVLEFNEYVYAEKNGESQVSLIITPATARFTDDIHINASLPSYVKPDELRYAVDILDPDGNRVDSTLWFARADFDYTFKTWYPALNITKLGKYKVVVEGVNGMERTGKIVETSFFELTTAPPPSFQIKRGVSSSNVICNDGLELAFKKSDKTSVCVKPTSVEKLVAWGWAIRLAA